MITKYLPRNLTKRISFYYRLLRVRMAFRKYKKFLNSAFIRYCNTAIVFAEDSKDTEDGSHPVS